jgi:hypothetical protein
MPYTLYLIPAAAIHQPSLQASLREDVLPRAMPPHARRIGVDNGCAGLYSLQTRRPALGAAATVQICTA